MGDSTMGNGATTLEKKVESALNEANDETAECDEAQRAAEEAVQKTEEEEAAKKKAEEEAADATKWRWAKGSGEFNWLYTGNLMPSAECIRELDQRPLGDKTKSIATTVGKNEEETHDNIYAA